MLGEEEGSEVDLGNSVRCSLDFHINWLGQGVFQRQQGQASPVAVTLTSMTNWPQSHPACLGTRELVCQGRMS